MGDWDGNSWASETESDRDFLSALCPHNKMMGVNCKECEEEKKLSIIAKLKNKFKRIEKEIK